jgi:predicted nucleic acid-binding protein
MNKAHAVNPTVIHETYHTCVFKLKRASEQTVKAILNYMKLTLFLSVSGKTTEQALKIASEYKLGGRDALIISSYLSAKQVVRFITLDEELLNVGQVKFGNARLVISEP